METKKILCSSCDHLQVCSFKIGFTDLVKQIDAITKDISFNETFNTDIECKYYNKSSLVPRNI